MTAVASENTESGIEASDASPYRWFLTLWPLAVIFHLAGNDWFLLNLTEVGVLQIPFLIAAIAMLFRPTPITAAALAATHILVVSAKLPAVGNHEILLLLIHLAVLIAVFTKDKQWLPVAVPPLRWVLLIAYSAIAFSKLNEDFVDRAVSCAVIFGDEFGDWVNVSISNSAALSYMVIALTLLFELSIPILLMTRSLRRFGVVVGMIFHSLLAIEPSGHVFDFTSVLFVLFLLFLSPHESGQLSSAVQRARERLLPVRGALIVAAMIVGNLLMHRSSQNGYFGPTWLFDFPIWCVYAAFLFRTVVPIVRGPRDRAPKLAFRVAPALALVVLLTSMNAASPYLELRTAGAFNMYSNLRTYNGQTNHFLVPGTLPLNDDARFFRYTPDPAAPNGLDFYTDQGGFIIPEANLVQWARTYPSLDVEVQLAPTGADTSVEFYSVQELAAAYGTTDSLVNNVFFVRAVDPDTPTSCRRYWGPAN